MEIPNSVTSIGDFAFNDCSSLTSVTYNANAIVGYRIFARCTLLKKLTIGNEVSIIPDGIFYECKRLSSITIPASVITIGSESFRDCTGLKNIVGGDGIKKIGDEAFSGCSSLEYFRMGSSAKVIGDKAFSGCTAITQLISAAAAPPICGNQALDDINKETCELFVPQESINKYKTADQWKKFMNIYGFNGVDDVSVDTPDALYEVYNLQGVRVGSGMREAEVTTDALPHGVYILVSPQGRKKLKI